MLTAWVLGWPLTPQPNRHPSVDHGGQWGRPLPAAKGTHNRDVFHGAEANRTTGPTCQKVKTWGKAWVKSSLTGLSREREREKEPRRAQLPPENRDIGNVCEREGRLLTIFCAVHPLPHLGHTGQVPHLPCLLRRPLQALLDLDSLVGPDDLAKNGRVTYR